MTDISKLYVILCGYEILPRTVSTRDSGERFVMSLPICSYLLETSQGLVLFDAGINSDILHDPHLRNRYFTSRGRDPAPVVWPQHEFLPQLKEIGVDPDDIRHVILSHMHVDHAGNLKYFRRAKVWLQQAEYDYAFQQPTPQYLVRTDFDFPDMDWCLLRGDHEVMPGLELISTVGHTPGHQSAVISLPHSGRAVLVGDVGDLMENFEHEILPGQTSDDEAALASIRRVNQIHREEGAELFLCHDPNLIQTQKLSPEYYD